MYSSIQRCKAQQSIIHLNRTHISLIFYQLKIQCNLKWYIEKSICQLKTFNWQNICFQFSLFSLGLASVDNLHRELCTKLNQTSFLIAKQVHFTAGINCCRVALQWINWTGYELAHDRQYLIGIRRRECFSTLISWNRTKTLLV